MVHLPYIYSIKYAIHVDDMGFEPILYPQKSVQRIAVAEPNTPNQPTPLLRWGKDHQFKKKTQDPERVVSAQSSSKKKLTFALSGINFLNSHVYLLYPSSHIQGSEKWVPSLWTQNPTTHLLSFIKLKYPFCGDTSTPAKFNIATEKGPF